MAKTISILLTAKDMASGNIKKVSGELGGLNSHGKVAAVGLGSAGLAANKLGGALKHARGEIGNLISGPLGLIGLGAGLFSIEHLLSESVDEARSFGSEVAKLSALTGESAKSISEMVGALHHFGIDGDTAIKVAGFYEKGVNKLVGTTKLATKFQKEYGISLVDSKGKVVDFNTAILRSADLFTNKAIPAGTKAAALAKIWGRGYTQLIPLLAAGPKAIKAAMEEAAAAGFTVTAQNVKDLAELREATRALDTSLGGLKLQIGLALVGPLTEASRAISDFLAHGGTQQITGVVKGAVEVGREVGGAISSLGPLVKGIADAWNAIPADFRKLLIGGLVVNKGLKTIFGFDPINFAVRSATSLLTGGIKAAVVNVSGGVVNTPGVPVTGVPGAPGGVPPGVVVPAIGAAIAIDRPAMTQMVDDWLASKGITPAGNDFGVPKGTPGRSRGGSWANVIPGQSAADRQRLYAAMRGVGEKLLPPLDLLHRDFIAQRDILKTGNDQAKADAAKKLAVDVGKGVGNVGNTKSLAAQLRATALTVKDPALRAQINAAAARIEHKIPGREWIAREIAQGQRIVHSNESTARKVSELKGIQQSLISHGDSAAARIVGGLMEVVTAVRGIKLTVNNVTGGTGVSRTGAGQRSHTGAGPAPIFHSPDMPGPGRAMGGPVHAGSMYTVGEMGPELFKPRVPGTIIPHGATRRIKQHGISDYNPYPHITEQNRDVRKASYARQRGVWDAEDRFFKNIPPSKAGPVMFNPNAILDPSQVEFKRGISTFGDRNIPMWGAGSGYGGSSHNYFHGQARAREYFHGQQPIAVTVNAHASARESQKAHNHWRRYGGNGAVVTLD